MAGFKDRSFYLPRNRINPPLDLQRQIFPWVESQIGAPESMEREEWNAKCIQEMNEINEDDAESFDRIEMTKKRANRYDQTNCVAMRGFLKLLVRCRRVILQDAAVRLHKGLTSSVLDNPIFESFEFKQFQAQVVQELDSLEDNKENKDTTDTTMGTADTNMGAADTNIGAITKSVARVTAGNSTGNEGLTAGSSKGTAVTIASRATWNNATCLLQQYHCTDKNPGPT
ncbi:hypothetical protein BGX26_004402 [Mortierella sp. AD094]|nr:hypothetical protein BGX26_004402 [Mortierella sp. AD094]